MKGEKTMAVEILQSTWGKPVELLFIEDRSTNNSDERVNLYLKTINRKSFIILKLSKFIFISSVLYLMF